MADGFTDVNDTSLENIETLQRALDRAESQRDAARSERDYYRDRPFRVVGSDDVEVALGRFITRDAAENLKRGMNDLNENWDKRNKRCRPPYRVQELHWEDVT